ncbi:hypothetical protein [Conchiformibius kuhniae]|uniref:Uncharacterized protein n=1 Tax=Conchiformibius kuhniae TaxID=211502 RepID=A0A8T9MU09_9NEIS|nr:hypothetical protein [Conchiformibius kuhniae]UOP04574.1 hypothetical protein LVJ77_10025 [Conchiformibius kuhniae]
MFEGLSHLIDLAVLLAAAYAGNVLAKQVKQRYLLKHHYRRQAVLTAVFWHSQAGMMVLIDAAVLYGYYLYSSFAHAPQSFQNQDVLRFLKNKS